MKRSIFYIIVGLQVLFLVGMSVSYYAMDYFGETVYLETVPIDPRDPFYGDYVTLRYDIEEFPADRWEGDQKPVRGDAVFLIVEKGAEKFYELVQASPQSQEIEEGQVQIKSKFEWHNLRSNEYQVNLGLDRYFVEENTGEEIEQDGGGQVAEVVVAPWGQKKIVSLQ
ncbi:GDYXXLXY domain-containing protein [Halobacillus seohaensis]|uniref:GDYXXLXY domain-containing protein n=1 Tax=Halobacillus seohaensis TaxID=447421 RepID=A0ABW2EEQ7_9BACI